MMLRRSVFRMDSAAEQWKLADQLQMDWELPELTVLVDCQICHQKQSMWDCQKEYS